MKKSIKIITLLTLWFLTISSVFAFQFFWKNKINYDEILKSNSKIWFYWTDDLCDKLKWEKIKEFCIFEKEEKIYIKKNKVDRKLLDYNEWIKIEQISNYKWINRLAQIFQKYDVIENESYNKLKWKYNNCISPNTEISAIPWLLWLRNYDWNKIKTKIDFEKNNCLIKNYKWEEFFIDLDYSSEVMLQVFNLYKYWILSEKEEEEEWKKLSFKLQMEMKWEIWHIIKK